jgi:ABC-type Fe3+/spermidine/putrescine transport system ATPase subunit
LGLLKAEVLEFTYQGKDKPVLSEINLEINRGEFVSIVGPSGSGKTTLLQLLAGHLSPTSGTLKFHDKGMEGPDIRLVPGYEEIRLVYQQYELRPNISAYDNIGFALSAFTSEYRKERINFLLDFFALTQVSNHKPYELSGGQQQRLAIAKAMANEPEVLLMDEPFSALDPMNSALFLTEVKRLAKETNTAVVLVTHDTRDAMMADRIVVLMKGKIHQSDTPDRIYYHPSNSEIAAFFGPVNILEPQEMEMLGGNVNQRSCVRAESFELDRGVNGNGLFVREIIFRGAYQVLVIALNPSKNLLVFDFGKIFKQGDQVKLKIKSHEIISF